MTKKKVRRESCFLEYMPRNFVEEANDLVEMSYNSSTATYYLDSSSILFNLEILLLFNRSNLQDIYFLKTYLCFHPPI